MGPEDAKVMIVGEQPGDHEDLAGKPFVGPAGQLFDRTLVEAGIDRKKLYVTNAVKHFKYEARGKRRIHQRPDAGEVQQCRWWLNKEIELVRPKLIVAMGATDRRKGKGLRGSGSPDTDAGGADAFCHGAPFLSSSPSRLAAEGGGNAEFQE
jgi:uracil-DNA glycosylase family protein